MWDSGQSLGQRAQAAERVLTVHRLLQVEVHCYAQQGQAQWLLMTGQGLPEV